MKPNNLNSSLFYFDYATAKKQWYRNFKEIIKDFKRLKKKSKTNIKKITEKDLRKTIETHEKLFDGIIKIVELQVKMDESAAKAVSSFAFITITLFRTFHKKDIPKNLESKLRYFCNCLESKDTKFKKKF